MLAVLSFLGGRIVWLVGWPSMMEAAVENKGAVVRHSTDPAQPGVRPPPTESYLCVVLLAGEANAEGWRWTCGGGRVVVGFQKVVMARFL